MLQLATATTDQAFWSGDRLELNLSFDNLRDYQWKRVLEGIWSYAGITGPFEKRFIPQQPTPPNIPIRIPEPTAAMSQFGAFEVAPNVQVGIELQYTRSLFECVSLLIPLGMFADLTPERSNEDFQQLEKVLYELAIYGYKITRFDIAAIGINRECQLMIEMMTNAKTRDAFLEAGNFLAQDDSLVALHADPKHYQQIMPSLRWSPPKT